MRSPSAAGPTIAAPRTSTAPLKSEVAALGESHSNSGYVDPEKRALDELNCLLTHPEARQAFYEGLRRTVEQVRVGEKDEIGGEKKPATCGP